MRSIAAIVAATIGGATVFENYTGTTPAAFNDPVAAGELAKADFDRGADVVFAAAGGSGLGVLQAAKDARKLAIGVDSDVRLLVRTPGVSSTGDFGFESRIPSQAYPEAGTRRAVNSIEVCLSGSGHPACGRRRLDGQALSPRWVRQRVGLLVGVPPRGRPHC